MVGPPNSLNFSIMKGESRLFYCNHSLIIVLVMVLEMMSLVKPMMAADN